MTPYRHNTCTSVMYLRVGKPLPAEKVRSKDWRYPDGSEIDFAAPLSKCPDCGRVPLIRARNLVPA